MDPVTNTDHLFQLVLPQNSVTYNLNELFSDSKREWSDMDFSLKDGMVSLIDTKARKLIRFHVPIPEDQDFHYTEIEPSDDQVYKLRPKTLTEEAVSRRYPKNSIDWGGNKSLTCADDILSLSRILFDGCIAITPLLILKSCHLVQARLDTNQDSKSVRAAVLVTDHDRVLPCKWFLLHIHWSYEALLSKFFEDDSNKIFPSPEPVVRVVKRKRQEDQKKAEA